MPATNGKQPHPEVSRGQKTRDHDRSKPARGEALTLGCCRCPDVSERQRSPSWCRPCASWAPSRACSLWGKVRVHAALLCLQQRRGFCMHASQHTCQLCLPVLIVHCIGAVFWQPPQEAMDAAAEAVQDIVTSRYSADAGELCCHQHSFIPNQAAATSIYCTMLCCSVLPRWAFTICSIGSVRGIATALCVSGQLSWLSTCQQACRMVEGFEGKLDSLADVVHDSCSAGCGCLHASCTPADMPTARFAD